MVQETYPSHDGTSTKSVQENVEARVRIGVLSPKDNWCLLRPAHP
jgi:hypothetical protein